MKFLKGFWLCFCLCFAFCLFWASPVSAKKVEPNCALGNALKGVNTPLVDWVDDAFFYTELIVKQTKNEVLKMEEEAIAAAEPDEGPAQLIGNWILDEERTRAANEETVLAALGDALTQENAMEMKDDGTFSWHAAGKGGEGTWESRGGRVSCSFTMADGSVESAILTLNEGDPAGPMLTMTLWANTPMELNLCWVKS